MNAKKITGLILLIIGAIILIVALYAKSRVAEVKKGIHKGSSMFSDNPVNRQIDSALEKKIGAYDTPILIGIIGGVILIVVGAGTMVYSRRR